MQKCGTVFSQHWTDLLSPLTWCARCAIYRIMLDCKKTTTFPTPGQSGVCRYHSATHNYVIALSRTRRSGTGVNPDPVKGDNLCLMNAHYILMPDAACTGVDDDRTVCTGTPWPGLARTITGQLLS